MQTQKNQKIDLNGDYPCPCRRRGKLVPIALTEAFGCNRCPQMFVVEENGYSIEQLSATYPYKRSWRWTGHQWNIAHSGLRESYLPLALVIVVVLLVVCLPLALHSPTTFKSIMSWVIITAILITVPTLLLWLAYRR